MMFFTVYGYGKGISRLVKKNIYIYTFKRVENSNFAIVDIYDLSNTMYILCLC